MLVKDPERRCIRRAIFCGNFAAYRWRYSAKTGPKNFPAGNRWPERQRLFPVRPYPATRHPDEDPGHAAKAKPPVSLDFTGLGRHFSAGYGFGAFCRHRTVFTRRCKIESRRFPAYPNVKQQWYYASKYGTEAHWKSIEKYFPKEGYYVDRANQQLALLYLKEGNYDKAMDIFEKFTYRGDGERELRAFGLAGQSVVLSYQGNYKESTNILIDEFLPLSNSLNNPQMDRYVQEAIKRNSSNQDSPAAEKA